MVDARSMPRAGGADPWKMAKRAMIFVGLSIGAARCWWIVSNNWPTTNYFGLIVMSLAGLACAAGAVYVAKGTKPVEAVPVPPVVSARPLIKPSFPQRDLALYPNPSDEPLEVQCKRLGVRMPNPGESMLEWGQSGPFQGMTPVDPLAPETKSYAPIPNPGPWEARDLKAHPDWAETQPHRLMNARDFDRRLGLTPTATPAPEPQGYIPIENPGPSEARFLAACAANGVPPPAPGEDIKTWLEKPQGGIQEAPHDPADDVIRQWMHLCYPPLPGQRFPRGQSMEAMWASIMLGVAEDEKRPEHPCNIRARKRELLLALAGEGAGPVADWLR